MSTRTEEMEAGVAQRVIARLEGFNRTIGLFVCRFALLLVLVQFAIVLLRYVFGLSYIFLSESVLYMHAILFMAGAGYALLYDKHVRVDIFYSVMSKQKQRAVNIAGGVLFLLPSMTALLWFTWPSVSNSWQAWEGAISVGGIPASFLLKTLIPIFCILLALQGIAFLMRDWLNSKETDA